MIIRYIDIIYIDLRRSYTVSSACIEEWSETCLNESQRSIVMKQIENVDSYVHLLCSNEDFQNG